MPKIPPQIEDYENPMMRTRCQTWHHGQKPGLANGIEGGTKGGKPVEISSTTRCGPKGRVHGQRSYADLMTEAILEAPDQRMTLAQIYDWMINHVPACREKADQKSTQGWKNSVRHNLSLHSRFVRIPVDGKYSFWTVDADKILASSGMPAKSVAERRRARTMDGSRDWINVKNEVKSRKMSDAGPGAINRKQSSASIASSLSEIDHDSGIGIEFFSKTSFEINGAPPSRKTSGASSLASDFGSALTMEEMRVHAPTPINEDEQQINDPLIGSLNYVSYSNDELLPENLESSLKPEFSFIGNSMPTALEPIHYHDSIGFLDRSQDGYGLQQLESFAADPDLSSLLNEAMTNPNVQAYFSATWDD